MGTTTFNNVTIETRHEHDDPFVLLCEKKCKFHVEWTDAEKFIWGKVYHELGFQSRHRSWKRAPVGRAQWLVIRHNAACLAVWAAQDANEAF